MMPEVVLCLDSESAQHPELVGLDGENFLAQEWLEVVCAADEARARLRSLPLECEVWVAASDDMDPLNLAAALKKDAESRRVLLLAFGAGGSLRSRASAAQVELESSYKGFARRYARMKAHRAIAGAAVLRQEEGAFEERQCAEDARKFQRAAHASGPIARRDAQELAPTVLVGSPAERERAARAGASYAPPAESPSLAQAAQERESPPVVFTVASRSAAPEASGAQAVHSPRAARADAAGKRAVLVTVAGASGGAGKSTVAALAAFIAQEFGLATLLLDADLQFGDMHHLSGIENPVTVREVAEGSATVEGLRPEGGVPALLAAPPRLEQSETLAGALPGIVERACAVFDVVVANTGAFWGEAHAQLIERSDHVLFVMDQRASSLRTARHALELCLRCGIATSPFLFVVNRCAKGALISSVDASCALGGVRAVELGEGGFEVDELLGAGLPFELLGSRNALVESLAEVIGELLPHAHGTPETRKPTRKPRFGRRKGRAACL